MNDIRIFIRKIANDNYSLNIKYKNNKTFYIYQFYNDINKLIFTEDNDIITLKYNDIIYNNDLDISLILFDLFNYKTIEYIDIYLQKKIRDFNNTYPTNSIIIDDIYNDIYDDQTMILTYIRNINNIFKLKFIVDNHNNLTLLYNLETINGFNEIIKKIDEIITINYLNQTF